MDVWSNIEEAMASNSKRRTAIWWIGGAAVAALTVIATYTALNNNEVNVNVNRPAETVKAENGVKNMPSVSAFEREKTTDNTLTNNDIIKNNSSNTNNKTEIKAHTAVTTKTNTSTQNVAKNVSFINSIDTKTIAANTSKEFAWLNELGGIARVTNQIQTISPFIQAANPQNPWTELPSIFTVYSENAFVDANNASNIKIKRSVHAPLFWRANVGYGLSNVGYAAASNEFVHRDFNALQSNNSRTIGSLQLELTAGKHLGNNWYATAGARVAQQGNQANYDFTLVPVGLDNTLNTDNFGNFPIVAYFDAFASNAKFATQQHTTVAELPIGIEKQWHFNNNFILNAGANAAAGMLINNVGNTLNYSDLSTVNVNPNWYRKVMLSNTAIVGLSKITPLGAIGLNVKGKYYPGNVYKVGSSIKQRPYDISVGLMWTGGLTK